MAFCISAHTMGKYPALVLYLFQTVGLSDKQAVCRKFKADTLCKPFCEVLQNKLVMLIVDDLSESVVHCPEIVWQCYHCIVNVILQRFALLQIVAVIKRCHLLLVYVSCHPLRCKPCYPHKAFKSAVFALKYLCDIQDILRSELWIFLTIVKILLPQMFTAF